ISGRLSESFSRIDFGEAAEGDWAADSEERNNAARTASGRAMNALHEGGPSLMRVSTVTANSIPTDGPTQPPAGITARDPHMAVPTMRRRPAHVDCWNGVRPVYLSTKSSGINFECVGQPDRLQTGRLKRSAAAGIPNPWPIVAGRPALKGWE